MYERAPPFSVFMSDLDWDDDEFEPTAVGGTGVKTEWDDEEEAVSYTHLTLPTILLV